ncbi:hypothetical protein ACFYUJ_21490 [Streptomyces sp. NPDC004520]|uniref:hypothetical protein n=1 Tax=Streptomyces sp. NPDC004520 TaxID=3364702 RepID=UPI00369C3987
MGLFSPKYPKSDTPGATGVPAKKESRQERAAREGREAGDRYMAETARMLQDAERASKERSARFWEDYERRNGKGSVDWS